jgi:hypothetical protein
MFSQMRFLIVFVYLVSTSISLVSTSAFSQTRKPFQSEIDEFKKLDGLQNPPKNPIIFVGSSSFRLWNNLQTDFPAYPILNRGFGGSVGRNGFKVQSKTSPNLLWRK